jgi:phage N-6-adenine-methyltransferase
MGFKEDRTENSRDDWETPDNLFANLNTAFKFKVDVCANEKNSKCENYYSEEQNGLEQDWSEYSGAAWCNPPYSKVKEWLQKAQREADNNGVTTVCLVAARPDTKYWHDIIFRHARAICFIRGRLQFAGAKWKACFPSALVVFSPVPLESGQIVTLARYGQLFVGGLTVRLEEGTATDRREGNASA